MAQESPLFWPAKFEGKILLVLDETLLPEKMHYVKVKNVAQAVSVIRDMKTRAFGQFLVVLSTFLLVLMKNKELFELFSSLSHKFWKAETIILGQEEL